MSNIYLHSGGTGVGPADGSEGRHSREPCCWPEAAGRVADCLAALIEDAGGIEALIIPRGCSHLGLAVIDAVFSLRAVYETQVVPVVSDLVI